MTSRIDSRVVLRTWWPLAASWAMMGLEIPIVSAVVARLPDPEVHLAAYGGVVFPLALLVEAPIIMLLAASTALSRDLRAYRKLQRFVLVAAGTLTGIHLLVAATPVFDWVVGTLLNAPVEIREPARIGTLIMTPWAAAIAIRRFQQGALIRFGHPRAVGVGTAVRLSANVTTLAVGALFTSWPGIAVGSLAVATGVVAEAVFVGLRIRPVVRDEIPDHDPEARPLTRGSFVRFYTPLALTSVLALAGLPLGSAAMGRMPLTLASLAVWPVINGLSFTLRSLGLAYNEVVVALLDREGAYDVLRAFAWRLAATVSGVLLLVAATPLAHAWFTGVSALPPDLAALAERAVWLAVPLPAASVLMALLTGVLVHHHRTRAVSEAVAIQLVVLILLLSAGAVWDRAPGIFVMLTAAVTSMGAQLLWLRRRALPSIHESRGVRRALVTSAWILGTGAAGAWWMTPSPVAAAPRVPDGFLTELVIGEPFLSAPVAFAFLPDGRVALVERSSGVIRLAAAGAATSDSIFTIDDVNADEVERGLLGVAADPEWPARPFLYFQYTATDGTVKVVRFTMNGALDDPASTAITPGARYVLLDDIDDLAGIHNAGTVRFAPDRTLLVAVGDDGQFCPAQDVTSPLGKLLRIDVGALPPVGPPSIAELAPTGNPFPEAAGYGPLVLAWGLRNPFRFTVDAVTGSVFLGSVGWVQYEEINRVPGAPSGYWTDAPNFGWPQREGPDEVSCCGSCGLGNPFTEPIFAFPHPFGPASVIGGAVLRPVPGSPNSFPASLDGDYLFAEIFSGDVYRLAHPHWELAEPAPGQPSPDHWGEGFPGVVDIQLGPDGALYLLSFGLSPDLFPRGLYRVRPLPPGIGSAPGAPPAGPLRIRPNPGRGGSEVIVSFRPVSPGPATIRVIDAGGRTVRKARVTVGAGGAGKFPFDGRRDDGTPLGAGVYLVAVTTPRGKTLSGKLTWIR